MIQVKQFIHETPCKIKGIEPIKTTENKYGKEVYFYLINNNNLHLLKESTFSTDFKEQKEDDFKWFLNRYAVYICNTEYLLNKFIKTDINRFLNSENWTKKSVLLN
jgi:hypothetical protein